MRSNVVEPYSSPIAGVRSPRNQPQYEPRRPDAKHPTTTISTCAVKEPPGTSTARGMAGHSASGCSCLLCCVLYQFCRLGGSYCYPVLERHSGPVQRAGYRQDSPFTATNPPSCRLPHRSLALDLAHKRYRISRLVGIIDSGDRGGTDGPDQDQQ